jgi:hypothetical protein
VTESAWTPDELARIGAADAVDDAHRQKYGRYTSYSEPRIAPQVLATTLRLVPRETVPA